MGQARRARAAARAATVSTIIFPAMASNHAEKAATRVETMRQAKQLAGDRLDPHGDVGWREYPASEVFAVLPNLFGDSPTDYERKFMQAAFDHASAFPDGYLVIAFVEAHLEPGWHDDNEAAMDMPWANPA